MPRVHTSIPDLDSPDPHIVEPVPGVHTSISHKRIPDDCVQQAGTCEPFHKRQFTGSQVQHTAAQSRVIDRSLEDIKAVLDSILNKPGTALLVPIGLIVTLLFVEHYTSITTSINREQVIHPFAVQHPTK